MQFLSHLLKSIDFAPSLSFNAYPTTPMAVRTHDLSASVSVNWKACSYAAGERANLLHKFLLLLLLVKKGTLEANCNFSFEQKRELVTLIAIFQLTCHEQRQSESAHIVKHGQWLHSLVTRHCILVTAQWANEKIATQQLKLISHNSTSSRRFIWHRLLEKAINYSGRLTTAPGHG